MIQFRRASVTFRATFRSSPFTIFVVVTNVSEWTNERGVAQHAEKRQSYKELSRLVAASVSEWNEREESDKTPLAHAHSYDARSYIPGSY
jgi:hypothetical protein